MCFQERFHKTERRGCDFQTIVIFIVVLTFVLLQISINYLDQIIPIADLVHRT